MTNKITSLTKEQEAQIPKYVQKWIKQASEPTNRDEATTAIKQLYKRMGEEEPLVVFGRSPNETILMALTVFGIAKDYDWSGSQLDSQLRSQLYSQLGSQLYSQLGSQLHSQLYSQLDSQLDSQLYSQLDSQLRSQLYSQLGSQLYSQLGSQLHSQLYSQLDSQLGLESDDVVKGWLQSLRSTFYEHDYWLVWCGWYEFGQYIGVEFNKDAYDLFMTFNKNVGFTIPYKGIVFMSDRPTHIRWANERLHYDHGMAVEWSDGFGYYALNGVVGFKEEDWKKIVDQTLTLDDLGKIENADQRAVANQYLKPETLIQKENGVLVSTSSKVYDAPQFHPQVLAWFRNKGENLDGEADLTKRHFEEYNKEHKTTLYKLPNYMGQFGEQFVAVFTHPTVPTSRYVKYQDPKTITDADGFHVWARSSDMITITKQQWLEMPEA